MGAAITLAVGVLILGVPFDPAVVDWPLLVVVMASASRAIIAIGVLLAAICLQTRQESWSYPEAVAGALFLVSGAVFPLSVLPLPIQAIGLADPLTWWLEGVRQALFPGGLSAIGGPGSLCTDLSGQLHRAPPRSSSPCSLTGAVGYTRGDCRLPLERAPGQGSRAAGPDDGLLGRPARSTGASRGRTGFVRIYEGSPAPGLRGGLPLDRRLPRPARR